MRREGTSERWEWPIGRLYILAGYIVHTSNRVAPIIGSAITYQPKYIGIILETHISSAKLAKGKLR